MVLFVQLTGSKIITSWKDFNAPKSRADVAALKLKQKKNENYKSIYNKEYLAGLHDGQDFRQLSLSAHFLGLPYKYSSLTKGKFILKRLLMALF